MRNSESSPHGVDIVGLSAPAPVTEPYGSPCALAYKFRESVCYKVLNAAACGSSYAIAPPTAVSGSPKSDVFVLQLLGDRRLARHLLQTMRVGIP